MKINPKTIKNVIEIAKLEDIISEDITLKKQGSSFYGKCPVCGKDGKGKGLIFTPAKNIFKCFSCETGGNSAIDYLITVKKITYPDAIKYLAKKYGIEILKGDIALSGQSLNKNTKFSFCEVQLAESGLIAKDITARVYVENDTLKETEIFQAGTLSQYGHIEHGNDMIIWYYDLEGKPTMYQKPKSQKFEHLFRVRWQFPDQHLDKNGNSIKYQSPYGSGQHLYFPDIIRNAYHRGTHIKRLYLQEGEKKAEKACKHGLFSIGLMGINSIGHSGRLPHEINLIVQKCNVEEVVFVVDSDWDQLTTNPKVDKPLDYRPRSFFSAIRNFKDYFRTLTNQGIFVELYFGYYHQDKKHKGIDDQLTCFFKNKELDVRDDFDRAINEKNGVGRYYTVHKVTTEIDSSLLRLWHLETAENFANFHKEYILKSGLKEFTIGKHRWRFNENEVLELAQPILDDEKFWEDNSYTDKNGNHHEKIQFRYSRCYKFLKTHGFGRLLMKSGKWDFINIENKIVKIVEASEMKDYIISLTREICNESIMDMFFRGGKMYFGPESLSNIDFIQPEFKHTGKDFQYIFFKNKFWKVTALGIQEKDIIELDSCVWYDKIIDYTPSLLAEKMVNIQEITQELIDKTPLEIRNELTPHLGSYNINYSNEAKNCHFLQFLINTCDFNWKNKEKTIAENYDKNRHLVAKMTAFGYMMHKHRNKSCEKAVICMDGKLSEVGESNGRSGKSLFGFALDKMVPTAYINAKAKTLTDDPFWAEEVTEKTDIIFLDDVRANIDFEFFFPVITGKLTVNGKGIRKFTLSENDTPKVLITTNHAIAGNSGSFRDRQALLAFSDFYSETRKPIDICGINFWSEWNGTEQWNLFYNFMGQCIELYLQIGLVTPMFERLELRRMRQFIGEEFMEWANEYYGTSDDMDVNEVYSANNVNQHIPRAEIYKDFLDKNPMQKKFVTPNKFKKKIKTWCDYMGLKFNPHKQNDEGKPGGNDKTGSVEYFTIANNLYYCPGQDVEF